MTTDVVVLTLGLSNPNVKSTQKSSPSFSLLLNVSCTPERSGCHEQVLAEAVEA
jgi:hypothetical protein